jgi:hypothetical protein
MHAQWVQGGVQFVFENDIESFVEKSNKKRN